MTVFGISVTNIRATKVTLVWSMAVNVPIAGYTHRTLHRYGLWFFRWFRLFHNMTTWRKAAVSIRKPITGSLRLANEDSHPTA